MFLFFFKLFTPLVNRCYNTILQFFVPNSALSHDFYTPQKLLGNEVKKISDIWVSNFSYSESGPQTPLPDPTCAVNIYDIYA